MLAEWTAAALQEYFEWKVRAVERKVGNKEIEGERGGERASITLETWPRGLDKTGVETVLLLPGETPSDGPILSTFGLFEAGSGSKDPLAWTVATGGTTPGPTVSTLPLGLLSLK